MKRRVRPLIFVLLILTLAGVGYWTNGRPPLAWDRGAADPEQTPPTAGAGSIATSGFIEVRQVAIAPEVGGTVARLPVDEGDPVQAGQVLAEIDAQHLDAQIAEARATLAMAEAQLARVEAGLRGEEIAVTMATLSVAKARRDAAHQAWQDAILLRDNPQEIELQIAAAAGRLAVAEARIAQMTAVKDAAELVSSLRGRQVDFLERGIDLHIEIPGFGQQQVHQDFPEGHKRQAWAAWNLATTDVWSAWVVLNQAIAARDAARQSLRDLQAMHDNPQQADVQVAQAEAAYHQAVAAVEVARSNLRAALAGASEEQIAVARAGVAQARAALATLQVQREKYTLRSPMAGTVLERIVHEGENARPGVSMLKLGNLDTVELTVYVPEPDMGWVYLGQSVAVAVDSFPDQTFAGEVSWIGDRAEFTPRNVQTREDRVNTVFPVKVRIPNLDGRLRPGMPADAAVGGDLRRTAPARLQLPGAAARVPDDRIVGSGAIEAAIIAITAETGGRVVAIYADEGEEVRQGDRLAELDTSLLTSQQNQLQTALDSARARLVEVSAPPRPEVVAVAQAELAQAQAHRDGAEAVWREMRALLDNPLELNARINAVRGQITLLEKQVEAAQASLKAAEIRRDEAGRNPIGDEALTVVQVTVKQVEAAQANLTAAEAELAGARRQLALLQDIRGRPLTLMAQANTAESAFRQAEAAVQVARARLALAEAGPMPEEVAIAEAQVRQAEAALARLQVELDKMILTAPRQGLIVGRPANPGELVTPGTTLMELGDLGRVTLTVFVPATQIGWVQVGQEARVRVDAYPGETFRGTVSTIAAEAEFTPKNVQTQEERVNLVFAVKIGLDNPDRRLRPGMPADAELVR